MAGYHIRAGWWGWPGASGGGAAPALAQFKATPHSSGVPSVILDAVPTPGNKLVWCNSIRDGPYTTVIAIPNFTAGQVAYQESRSSSCWLYRDVIAADGKTWPPLNLGNLQRACVLELAGVVAGNATAHKEENNTSTGNAGSGENGGKVGTFSAPGAGIVVCHITSGVNNPAINLSGMTKVDAGMVDGGYDPSGMTLYKVVTGPETIALTFAGWISNFGTAWAFFPKK